MNKNDFFKQNDPLCLPVIRSVGCFARSAMHVGELIAGRKLTVGQINDTWEWAKVEGFITKDNNLRESAPITNRALLILGYPGKVYETGTFSKGKLTWYPSVPDKMRQIDYLIQKIGQNGPEGTHFRNITRNGKLLWDPHEPEIRVKKIFYSIIYTYVA